MLTSLYACLLGFMLDLLIGDPQWKYHPIRLIGKLIEVGENIFRGLFPGNDKGELLAGLCMTISVATLAMLVPYFLLVIANMVSPLLSFLLESILLSFVFSTKALKTEAVKIYKLLVANKIVESKKALSMIVGRDTDSLDKEGIIKATIESISENTTDGVIAPLLFSIIGGAPFACFYKAVNTMDSMVGYKNEKYMFFGKYSAKLDDVLNHFPSRIAANIMIFVSFLPNKFDYKNAKKIYQRDRCKHASPNSGHTEAVCAGALRIQLAGDAYYFGKKYKKEYIGDSLDISTPEKILMANKLLYLTAVTSIVLFSSLKFLLIYSL